jgi:hypothetical protein
MRTLILSDLHLGSLSRADLLRNPEIRAPLLKLAAESDRVVLLGDVIELRHGPMRDALAVARPFFEELGRALDGRELVMTAGNHDHALIDPWLANRGLEQEPAPLDLEQLLEPQEVSPALGRIEQWVAPASLRIAYPGLWIRPDVYAMHGHYLDCHLTVPTLERLSVGLMSRMLKRSPADFDCVEDYEAMGAPVFAWRDAVAREARTGNALNGVATLGAWHTLRGGSGGLGRSLRRFDRRLLMRRLRATALVAGFPLAVAALNRAGVGPLSPEVSTIELRRAGLRAMGEVAARLGLGDNYLVFGHTHRTGPLPEDDQHEWQGRSGARLVNAGSWTYTSVFLSSKFGQSPYWPGGCVLVEDTGAPIVLRLLQDLTLQQITPPQD